MIFLNFSVVLGWLKVLSRLSLKLEVMLILFLDMYLSSSANIDSDSFFGSFLGWGKLLGIDTVLSLISSKDLVTSA